MNITPMYNRVAVRQIEEDFKSPAGIILQTESKEKPTRGEIVAVGPGQWSYGRFIEPVIKVGDQVLFSQFAGSIIKVTGEPLLMMTEADIIAILD